jgi:hypothetical protein
MNDLDDDWDEFDLQQRALNNATDWAPVKEHFLLMLAKLEAGEVRGIWANDAGNLFPHARTLIYRVQTETGVKFKLRMVDCENGQPLVNDIRQRLFAMTEEDRRDLAERAWAAAMLGWVHPGGDITPAGERFFTFVADIDNLSGLSTYGDGAIL